MEEKLNSIEKHNTSKHSVNIFEFMKYLFNIDFSSSSRYQGYVSPCHQEDNILVEREIVIKIVKFYNILESYNDSGETHTHQKA